MFGLSIFSYFAWETIKLSKKLYFLTIKKLYLIMIK
ncbi:hypothetical protein EDB47_12346 [Vibrio crassostreae]|nr:hypothetical protein EDB43_11743 [Vibrio crassostreae]TCU00484.1 hypothetical protein EDB47_12346 [Vibrio crassostreae]TDW07137.1 hypothetical protein EDB45_11743 [Vibrio crassostreae]